MALYIISEYVVKNEKSCALFPYLHCVLNFLHCMPKFSQRPSACHNWISTALGEVVDLFMIGGVNVTQLLWYTLEFSIKP